MGVLAVRLPAGERGAAHRGAQPLPRGRAVQVDPDKAHVESAWNYALDTEL
jgi:hypothetical protein